MKEESDRIKEAVERYGISLEKLEAEQKKLAKNIVLKDSINFSLADRVAGIENIYFQNKIVSAVVVFSSGEILEQEYFEDKLRFPYIPGFLAYRDLPSMVQAFNMLDDKPDVVFIKGHGVLHPRNLGIASHFSLTTGVPAIGVADSLIVGEIKGDGIFFNNKLAGRVLKTKEGANPIYISPGNLISVNSAVSLVKKFTIYPHKIPEPLRLARKYGKDVLGEIFSREI